MTFSVAPRTFPARLHGACHPLPLPRHAPLSHVAAPPLNNWALVRRMLRLAWRYRWGCARLLILQGLLLLTALGTVGLVGLGIDLVRCHAGHAELPEFFRGWSWFHRWTPMQQVGAVAGAILLLNVLRGWLNFAYSLSAAVLVHRRIVVDLRAAVYEKMQRMSFGFFDSQATGSIMNRVTGDVQAVRAFIDGVIIQLAILAFSLVCYVAYMLTLHVGLTLACLLTTPVLWVITATFSRVVRPAYDRNRQLFDRLVLTLAETIQGMPVIKAFGQQPQARQRFEAANRAVQQQQQSIFWRISLFTPCISLLTQLNLVILLAYGGWLVAQDRLPLGSGLVVFASLLQQFSSQVANLTNLANSIQQSLSGARRVFEILDSPVEIQSPPDAVRLPRARGSVRFENVSFGYQPDREVLNQVSFSVQPGQRVAILGATGAGKTTLLNLLARFYDPAAGRILVDGIDLRRLHLDDLRRNIGLVFQETFLFSDTVANNIAFGNPQATRQQIQRAAEIAAAHEFITQLPRGYDTVLGEEGLDLSGGQRQRLAIARALLLDPPILVLDDPAASIDPHTEHEILQAMEQAMQGRTTFVVAHRLSTLRSADLVLVLHHGQLVQVGTHRELMRLDGPYHHVAHGQLLGAVA